MNNQLQEMLSVNQRQRVYYEQTDGTRQSATNNLATNLYRGFRRRCFSLCGHDSVVENLISRHQEWLPDLGGLRVLELGVGSGSPLSVWFAKNAGEYHAIDLSAPRLETLRQQLEASGAEGYRLHVGDFLESMPGVPPFDVVYAQAVLHHFRHMRSLLEVLSSRMADNGVLVSYDPLQTWFPARLMRAVYRPFQSDADWEFPFTRRSIDELQEFFRIEQVQGFHGRSKWAIPLGLVAPGYASSRADAWRRQDLESRRDLRSVMDCLQVSFLMRKKRAAVAPSRAA